MEGPIPACQGAISTSFVGILPGIKCYAWLLMGALGLNRTPMGTNKHLAVGIFLYAIATFVFIYALKFGALITLYPVIATSYIWTCLLARKYLGEQMNVYKWLGIATIIVGIPFLVIR
jgi:drug/metabolite transporter (DMT)-like permease